MAPANPSDTVTALPTISTVSHKLGGQPSTFSLGEVVFTRPGVYELVARVVNDDPSWDVTAVASEYAITVVVPDGPDGKLQATTRLPAGGLAFTGESVETAVTHLETAGVKVLDLASPRLGKTFADVAGQFEFTLTATETDAPLPPTTTATNDATGTIDFGQIGFTAADLAGAASRTFHYRVTETGWATGVDNDSAADVGHTFAVTLAIDADGRLRQTTDPASDLYTFTNTYRVEPVGVVIQAEKTLENRLLQDREFEFALTGGDGSHQTARHDAQGVANFAPVTLTTPGRYSYLIEELPGDDPDISYDRNATVVTLTAADDGSGHLSVTADPSEIVTFTNTCITEDEIPSTCDDPLNEPPDDETLANTGANVDGLAIVAWLLTATGTCLIRRRHPSVRP
jgi:pilin isopeptide linkage protein